MDSPDSLAVTGKSTRLHRIDHPEPARLKRIRLLSRLLDTCIVLPGGYRIGFDPLIGLLPGIGDAIAAAFSLYIIYEAARLGMSKRVLARMLGNVLVELIVGAIPVLGDIFDMAWKANVRNVQLIDAAYRPGAKERSQRLTLISIGTICALLVLGSAALGVLLIQFLLSAFQ